MSGAAAGQSELALEARTAELLREAQAWRLIGLLLERPREGWLREVTALGDNCAEPDLVRAARSAAHASEGAYLAWLRPGGRVSAREAGHRRASDPTRTLAEIRAFHAAFAFQPACEDPVDHVAIEAGFVAWLLLKQAYALANGDEEALAITTEATARFVREHVAVCAEPLAAALAEEAPEHLQLAARALAARAGPRPRDAEGDWVPAGLGVEEPEFGCGADGTDEAPELDLAREFGAGLAPEVLAEPPPA